MTIETIVFDLGGVLIDWNPRYLFNKLMNGDEEKINFFLTHVCSQEWNVQQDAGRSFKTAVEELIPKYPDFEPFIRAYDEQWETMIGGVMDETVAILKKLIESRYSVFALTNWSAEKFRIARRRFEFLELFNDILVSGEVKLKKPDPEIYKLLFSRFAIDPKQAVFIDDSAVNIKISEELGMKGILYQNAEQLRNDLATLGVEI